MKNIGLILYPSFQVLGLSVCAAFEFANRVAGRPVYSISLLSEQGGPVRTSAGFAVETSAFDQRRFDTLMVVPDNVVRPTPAGLAEYLRRVGPLTRRVASICTGAFALADAGLLDGRRATTHWVQASALQARYPGVAVEEDRIFIHDGPIWTSGGMSAGLDLALALVADDLGSEVVRAVSRYLVIYHRRGGGQAQFSAMPEPEPQTERIQAALSYARDNLQAVLSVEVLAEAAHLSPRQFSRLFQAETGQSPAKAIEKLRVESARTLLESGGQSMEAVADASGFGERERMRRAFIRAFGQPPQMIQRAHHG